MAIKINQSYFKQPFTELLLRTEHGAKLLTCMTLSDFWKLFEAGDISIHFYSPEKLMKRSQITWFVQNIFQRIPPGNSDVWYVHYKISKLGLLIMGLSGLH